jgi:hypothetical protein
MTLGQKFLPTGCESRIKVFWPGLVYLKRLKIEEEWNIRVSSACSY